MGVVPYVGTWIEMFSVSASPTRCSRRSLRGNVDRNSEIRHEIEERDGRSLRGNVDRNDCVGTSAAANYCRSLRGNVDRNGSSKMFYNKWVDVVPYVGTWIEIFNRQNLFHNSLRRSLRGNVDRNANYQTIVIKSKESFPTWERG